MRSSTLGSSIALALLTLAAHPREARAKLDRSIDLTAPPYSMKLQAQADPRWSKFFIGPFDKQGQQDSGGAFVTIGRCGCLLTSMSTAFTHIGPGAFPWFKSQQILPSGAQQSKLSFSPKYLDDFFNIGPAEGSRPIGWAYLPGSGGTNCQAGTDRHAPTGIAKTAGLVPTGFTWAAGTFEVQRKFIDQALLAGQPAIFIRKTFGAHGFPIGGRHASLIVGWDASTERYLIYDPMWTASTYPDNHVTPRAAGHGFYGATDAERYSNFLAAIEVVYVLELTTEPHEYLQIKDDPEPIKLRLTDPLGRRTGYDPETDDNLQEDRQANFVEVTSFTDPLLLLPEAPVYRYITVRDPLAGGYGLEVFGTGDGPYTLTLAKVAFDQSEDLETVTGDIVSGEVVRYEVVRKPNGALSIDAVAAFAPRARAGNDASAFLNTAVPFDGRGSYEVSGQIAAWAWDFGDGDSADGAQQTHAYATAGTFTATLTVTNVDGLTGTDTRLVVVVDPATLPVMETLRVSTDSQGLQANGQGYADPAVTDDGRYVAFSSTAPDLVAGDTNLSPDIFVKDLETGAIERVSVASGGSQAESPNDFVLVQDYPAISADGRFVTFSSSAPNLFAGDVELTTDLFLHDRMLGTTELVSQGGTFDSSISADGRFVAFTASLNILPEDVGFLDIYLLDRQTAVLELISVSSDEVHGNDVSSSPHVSDDGNLVAFVSEATNFGGPPAPYQAVWVRDRQAGTTTRASLSAAGNTIPDECYAPSMSADGRFVAFVTDDNNVAPDDNNVGSGGNDVYVRDTLLGTTERVSVSSSGEGANQTAGSPAMSPDGRFVAFVSAADNLAPDGSVTVQAYLRDRQELTTTRVTVDINGMPATNPAVLVNNNASQPLRVSNQGAVVFPSGATTLVLDDTNGKNDLFIRRVQPGSGAATTPIANLGGPYLGWASSEAVPAGIRLDASASADPQGRTLTAQWDFGDGSPAVEGDLTITHAWAEPGIYQVTLLVRADGDVSEPRTTEVEVMPALGEGDLTVAACAAPGDPLSLGGSAVAANATLVDQGWDRSAGPMPLEPATVALPWGEVALPTRLPALTFRGTTNVPGGADAGSFTATLPGAADATFTIPCGTRANAQPLAVAGGPVYQAQAGAPVTLDGSGSSDAEGSPLTYTWHFGDGTVGTDVRAEHVYQAEGSYMVTLIVNDGTEDSADMIGTNSFAMVVVTAATEPTGSGSGAGPDSDRPWGLAAEGGGCGCTTSGGQTPLGLGFAMALLLAARRRRAQSRS